MEWVSVWVIGSLGIVVLCIVFEHLIAQDAEEGRTNMEDACLYHTWGREAGELRCAACGKVPQE